MYVNRLAKLALGVVTALVPLVLVASALLGYWATYALRAGRHLNLRIGLFGPLYIALVLVLLAFYMIHAWRSSRVPAEKKRLWLGALLFLGVYAMPVYWYRFIWKQST